MEMEGHVISGIKVVSIFEGNTIGIEKMANKMITDLHKKIQKYSTFKKRKQYYPSTRLKRIIALS